MGAWLAITRGTLSQAVFWEMSPAQVAFQIDDYVKRNRPQSQQRKGTAGDLMAIFGGDAGTRLHNRGATTVPVPELADS